MLTQIAKQRYTEELEIMLGEVTVLLVASGCSDEEIRNHPLRNEILREMEEG